MEDYEYDLPAHGSSSRQRMCKTTEPANDELWFGTLFILVYAAVGFFLAWLMEQRNSGQGSVAALITSLLFAVATVIFLCATALRLWRTSGKP